MIKSLIGKLFDALKSLFLNGILLILPIAVTVFLVRTVFCFVKGWLIPLKRFEPVCIQNYPHSEIILAVFLIFLMGFISKNFFLKRFMHAFEEFMKKIPLLGTIYSGVKQLSHAFTDQDKVSFNQVVLAEFPTQGSYCVGFLTGVCPQEMTPNAQKTYLNIYIPTTPNPTTGFFILMPQEKIIMMDLTRQEAMSIIISGGIIQPARFKSL